MTHPVWRRQMWRRRATASGIGGVAVALMLLSWHLATNVFGWFLPLFVPSPTAVAERFVQFWNEPYQGGTLLQHAAASLKVVMLGWLAGGVVGLPLGVLMGWNERVRQAVAPVFGLLRPIPPIAWIPLAILWFGLGDTARMFVVFVSAVVPWVLNSYEAVAGVDRLLVRAGSTLGAGSPRLLAEIVLPASVPILLGGARIALGNAWMTVVAAELLGATEGLGYVTLSARQTLDSDIMLVAMLIIGLLGVLFSEGLRLVERRMSHWRPEATTA